MSYKPEEILNLRVQNKTDTKQNWDNIQDTFVPLKGELIVYSDINAAKIGDGKTSLANLPFVIDKPISDDCIKNLFK